MTSDLSLTDRSTWIALLTVVATVLSIVFHRSFAAYVPVAATVASGLVIAGLLLAKHHYQAAITRAASTLQSASRSLPVGTPVDVSKVAAAVQEASKTLASTAEALSGIVNPVHTSGPLSPPPQAQAAPTAAQAPPAGT